jgi:hypothetical protein
MKRKYENRNFCEGFSGISAASAACAAAAALKIVFHGLMQVN